MARKTKIINIIDSESGGVISTLKVPSSLKPEQIMQVLKNQNIDPKDQWVTNLKVGQLLGKEIESENYLI
ncbi:hypothetical protein [Clostridium sp.]|uniref:hypothetical protein n=1 Tax=Clostridium sp. TaxID=1506 RepID=UPI001B5A45D0|nr:hypothetical protein [Clostridium sp.]MBP3916745.1 hypothetical protein [Clostridium sp.]